MSDETSKPPPPRPAPSAPAGPPRLERVPKGHLPPGVRPPPASPPAQAATYGLAPREVGADAAIAAGLAGEGSLASESALRVFALAAAAKATGRLSIAAEGRTFALSFRRGTVEHAASTDPDDDLGRFLVLNGKLSEDQRARAEAGRDAAGGDLATALVAQRLVNPADAAALLSEHGGAIVVRALAVEAGRWSWAPNAPPPPSAFPLGAPLGMLSAAARALDADALRRRLGDRERRAASRTVARVRFEDLRLGPQEARAAALFDGKRSPAELAQASPADSTAILRTALLLSELDLVAFGPPRAAGASAPAAAPRPAAPAAAATGPAQPGSGAASPAVPRPAAAPSVAKPPVAPAAAKPAAPTPVQARPPEATPASAEPAGAGPLDRAALEALVARVSKADHFEVLGVKREATSSQIKIAYFQLAKAYHPDAVPPEAPTETRKLCADVFAKVSEAWAVLGDGKARAQYVEELASGGAADLDVMRILQAENVFTEATILVKARRYGDALPKLDEAIGLNGDEPEFSIWKSFCEFCLAPDKKRKLAEASGTIEGALKRNPRCAQGYLFLGQMAKVAGDLALAEKHLRRGLSVAPDHADLQRELKYLRR